MTLAYGRPAALTGQVSPSVAARRAVFAATAATTATPQALLVMLYDRLVLDLERAESAQHAGEVGAAHRNLVHAQDIVTELGAALDVDAWAGGPGLASLYTWLGAELLQANITKDPAVTAACRAVVEPLRDTWREAAGTAVAAAGGAPSLGGTA